MKKPLVDIIIPSYNNKDELLQCLTGLEIQEFKEFRVWVCLDGSSDGSEETVKDRESDLDLSVLTHEDKKNQGRNAARNLALPFLSGQYVVLLDSDLVPQKDYLKSHISCLEKGNCISVGSIEYTNTASNIWGAYLMSRGHHKYRDGDKIPYYYFLTGNSALKTEALLEIGGFDQQLRTYGGNDLEIAYRLWKQYQFSTVYNKAAMVKGTMDKSLSFALEQISEFGAINLHYIREKHPEFDTMFKFKRLIKESFAGGVLWWNIWEKLSLFLLTITWGAVRNAVIHYLVAKYMRLGFTERRKIKATLFNGIT